jgi:hypothetical protein
MKATPTKVIFTGYAPVHFVCFSPLYRYLSADPRFEVFVSGGLREEIESEDGQSKSRIHDALSMYRPFGIPDDHILTVDQIRDMDFDVMFGANTKMIAPRSVGTRVQIFHGVSFRNKAIREENLGADFYFLAGPYMKRKFAAAGLLAEDDPRGLRIGFMKTDALIDGSLSRSILLRKNGFTGDRPVLLFAPTGQRYNSLETMGVDVLRQLKATGKYDILIKMHDHPKDTSVNWFDELRPLEDEHCRVSRDLDVIPLLFLADLLITDASSVSSEYSLLDRPMVFLDVPKLLAKGAKSGSMDLDTWGRNVGDIVYSPDEITGAIELALREPQRHGDLRRSMAADLFFNPGEAASAGLSWLESKFELLKERSHRLSFRDAALTA